MKEYSYEESKLVQHNTTTDEIQEEEEIEHNNIKVSLSVYWLAQSHTKWPRG